LRPSGTIPVGETSSGSERPPFEGVVGVGHMPRLAIVSSEGLTAAPELGLWLLP
jgi:hypothetical protein